MCGGKSTYQEGREGREWWKEQTSVVERVDT